MSVCAFYHSIAPMSTRVRTSPGGLLYGTFGHLRDAFLLLGTVPLALIGGILSLLVTHTSFSISAAVGFISLFGVSVLGGVILVSRIKQLREQERLPLYEAISRGAALQLRPVLMAALAAAIGLLPASVATGIGSETQQPLARVVGGGVVTTGNFIFFVLPPLYFIFPSLARGAAPIPGPHETGTARG